MEARRKRQYKCSKCTKDFGSPFALGYHFKKYPNHRTKQQREKREANEKSPATKCVPAQKKKVQRAYQSIRHNFCFNCGNELEKNWTYCASCGRKL